MAQMPGENSIWAGAVRAAAAAGTLSHAIILAGSGDTAAAAHFTAAAHLCDAAPHQRPCLGCRSCDKVLRDIHPDVVWVEETDKRDLPVETVRAMRQDAYIRPNEGRRKVYIFPRARQLNEKDQNVLLKLLEDGPPYGTFLFCTEAAQWLLPTVRSRCVTLAVPPEEDDGTEDEQAAALCRLLGEGDEAALCAHLVALELDRPKREQLQTLMEQCHRLCAAALTRQYGSPRPCPPTARRLASQLDGATLQRAVSLFARYGGECRYNIGPAHLLGGLMAELSAVLQSRGR